jgi:diacylglycerol O-acyltransferase
VSDPAFDLAQHVHRITLRKPGTLHALLAKVCELHPQRLDRSRPLWEFYLIDGLEGGRVALYAKMHHGIVDGAGFVKIILRWLSASPKDRVVRAMWEGVEGATAVRREQDSLARRVGKLLRMGAGTARTALSFSQLLWHQGMTTLGADKGVPLPFVTTSDALKAAPSARRSFAHCTLPLGQVKALGKTRDATVNDMLLTVLDIALIRYLKRKHAAPAKPLVADMPVALGAGGSGGNRIAMVQLPLGAPDLDPVERLEAIAARTRAVKGQLHGGAGDAAMLHSILTHGLPSLWEALRLQDAPLLANLVVSNPFGFADKRYLMGAEVDLVLPISVVAPGQVLNITAVNYVDRYQIAFLAIAEAVPDIGLLATYTEEAFATLATSLGGNGRKRRSRGRAIPSRRKKKPQ